MSAWLDALKFNKDGLIPAVAQDFESGQILMVAWQNRQALALTAQTGQAVYFSRSRGKLWHKGESSGHMQIVHEIYTDCDADVIVLKVTQQGGIACHTGRMSCFYQQLDWSAGTWQTAAPVLKDPKTIYGDDSSDKDNNTQVFKSLQIDENTTPPEPQDVLAQLDTLLALRKSADKDSSYVASLYHKGLNKILEKVGEEAVEAIIAAKQLELVRAQAQDDSRARADVVYEVADLWFHSMVALQALGLSSKDVLAELQRRFGLSGLDEKASRTPKA